MAVTVPAADHPKRHLADRPVVAAVVALLVLVTVALAGVFASAASASPLGRPQNAVGVIAAARSQVVGAHQAVLPGECRARAPNYDQTAVGSCVAAETGGGLDSAPVYRYVSEGEAQAAESLGRVPNTDLLGQARSVFYSPDYIASSSEAEQALQIGELNPGGSTTSPTFRITASAEGAQWTYGGNVEGGTGIEMLTEQALKVLRVDPLLP